MKPPQSDMFESEAVLVSVNADWIPYITAFALPYVERDNWQGTEEEKDISVLRTRDMIARLLDESEANMFQVSPRIQTFPSWDFIAEDLPDITWVGVGGFMGGYTYQNPATMWQARILSFVCEAGTYRINVGCYTQNDQGSTTWVIDTFTTIGAIDFYTAAQLASQVKSIDGVELSAGRHVLGMAVTGKHASSSGYRVRINYVQIQRVD